MNLGLCMIENVDLTPNAFKYKCEICQVFIHPFQKNYDVLQNTTRE